MLWDSRFSLAHIFSHISFLLGSEMEDEVDDLDDEIDELDDEMTDEEDEAKQARIKEKMKDAKEGMFIASFFIVY